MSIFFGIIFSEQPCSDNSGFFFSKPLHAFINLYTPLTYAIYIILVWLIDRHPISVKIKLMMLIDSY